MRQDISAPDLAVILGRFFKIDTRVEIENDVEWVDVSDRFVSADFTYDVDQHAASVVMAFARDDAANTASLSPLRGDSTMNADGPLITAGRQFRISVACVALGATFAGATYYELITGRIDKPNFNATPMTVEARDLGGLLIDTIATHDATYGDEDDAQPAADVGQQYLDDNMEDAAPTLVDISETDFAVTEFRQHNVPVMEGLNALATKAGGLVVRYKYDEDGVAQLTMYDPLRANTTADVTLTKSRITEIPVAAIDQTNIRNIIAGEFLDPVTGEVQRLEVRDTDSINAFGPRFMQLGAAVFEGMTGNEVLTVLNAALSDLRYPKFDHHVTRLLFWPAEIGDIVEFTANDVHYDETQTLAVVGVQHHLEKGHGTTTFLCRGTPAGAYLEWIRRQGTGPTGPEIPPAPELMFFITELSQFGRPITEVDGACWLGYRMPAGVDEIRIHALLGDGPNLGVPDLDNTTLAVTVRRPEGDIGKSVSNNGRTWPGRPGEYASMVLLSTRPQMYKRVVMYGVRGGLTSKLVMPPVRQAVDPGNPAEGTIANLTVTRSGTTNTVTVTPGVIETDPSNNGNWLFIERNKHILPGIYIQGDTSPVVFEDTGLDPSAGAEYAYRAFIWNNGVSGPLWGAIASAPDPAVAPQWADGTPRLVVESNVTKFKLSWTATTPGATGVRVEASLDQNQTRTVGTGALASGTVYDTVTTAKFYRLVATDALGPLAYSPWIWATPLPPTVINPTAIPAFINGTPKAVLQGPGGFLDIGPYLAIAWRCATPNARIIRIQESDDNGVSDPWSTVTDPTGESAAVAEGVWYSRTSAPVYLTKYYRLQALSVSGTVLQTSGSIQYTALA